MHLLVVDDDPSILELLEACIKAIGDYSVETASCVTDALNLLARPDAIPFDCFLLDIQMPGTDGIKLCRILRDLSDYKKTPILMLTAMSDKSYIDQAFAAGANDYLSKPFDIEKLRESIGMVESLVADYKKKAEDVILVDTDLSPENGPLALHEPFHVQDVEGVIGIRGAENYVTLLSRKKLFESAVFAFSIRCMEHLFEKSSRSEYECLITDVSEAIASSLDNHQYLVSYAGNGTFVCVVEGGWQPDPLKMTNQVKSDASPNDFEFQRR